MENVETPNPVEVPNLQVVADNPNPAPVPVSLKDDDLVEIVVGGEKVLKPWKEARANVQMGADYTRKTQSVAQQAKELQELFDGLTAKEKSIKEKEAAIDAILGRTPQNTGTPKPAADEVLTFGQLQELLKEHGENLTKQFESRVEQTTRQSEEVRNFQRWEDLTIQASESLVKEHPVLADIPQLDVILKREAMKDKPTNERELVEAIVKAGKATAVKLEQGYTNRRKQEALRRETLTTKGPERSSGVPQFAQPKKTYGEGRRINWSEIERDVIAALEAEE